jgi:hypothetical protein
MELLKDFRFSLVIVANPENIGKAHHTHLVATATLAVYGDSNHDYFPP